MPRQYGSPSRLTVRRKPNKITSISEWQGFARNRLAYLAMAVLIGFGLVAYFGTMGGSGSGSSASRGGADDAIAVVNGIPIKRGDAERMFDMYKNMMGGGDPEQQVRMQGMALNGLVSQAEMSAEAKRRGLSVSDADVDKAIESQKQQAAQGGKPLTDDQFQQMLQDRGMTEDQLRSQLRQDLLPQILRESIQAQQKVTPDDLLKSYDEGKIRHILIATIGGPRPTPGALPDAQAQHRAEMVLAKVKAGGDFEQLANEYSMDPGNKQPYVDPKTKKTDKGPHGGALGNPSVEDGWSKRGDFVQAFSDAAFALKPGQTSGLVKTEFGYHIIKLDAYRRQLPKDFDKNKAQLLKDLQTQRAQKPLQDLSEQLEKTAKIDWKDPYYKWRYDFSKTAGGQFMQQPSASAMSDQAFTAELKSYVAKRPDDATADLILGKRLDQQYMVSGIGLNGQKKLSDAERGALRSEVIAAYENALKKTEDRPTRFRLAELYEEGKQKDKTLDEFKTIARLAAYDTATTDKLTHTQLEGDFKRMGEPKLAADEAAIVAKITAQEAADKKKADDERKAADLAAKKAKAADATKPGAAGAVKQSLVQPPAGGTAPAPGNDSAASSTPPPMPQGTANSGGIKITPLNPNPPPKN